MMSKPEYRPCPHCGHQLKVRQYVRRFAVPSLPGGFCPATTAGFGAAGSAIRKRGHPATGCVAAPARKLPANK